MKLSLQQISKSYGKHLIFDTSSFELPSTGVVFLKGISGAGKTTFLNCLIGLDKFSEGQIFVDDCKVNDISKHASIFFQENYFFDYLTVYDNLKQFSIFDDSYLDNLLIKTKMFDLKFSKVSDISGGEKARLSFIRCLLSGSPIILMDEPFANLDEKNINVLCELIKEFSNEKLFIISSHQDTNLELEASSILNFTRGEKIDFIQRKDKCETSKNLNNKLSKINFKIVLKHFLSFFKRNLFKNIINMVLCLISFTFVCTSFSLLTADKNIVAYNAYKENNIQQVAFRRSSFNYDLGNASAYNSDIETLNPDYVAYDTFGFALNSSSQRIIFNKVLVYSNEYIQDFDVIVYGSGFATSKLTYKNYELKIIKVISNSENILCINKNTYSKICSNLYCNGEVTLNVKDGTRSVVVNNSDYYLYEYSNKEIISGTKPTHNDEIVIPENLVNLFCDSGKDKIIGSQIEIEFTNSSQYIVEKIYEKKIFTVTGISKQIIYLEDEIRDYLLQKFGWNSLENANKTLIFENYSYDTFLLASDLGLTYVGDFSNKIFSTFKTIEFLLPIFIVVSSGFILVAALNLILNVSTSINKSKKGIGLLKAFDMPDKIIALPFVLESIFDGFISLVISLPVSLSLVSLLNNIFSSNAGISIKPAIFDYLIFVYLIIFIIVSVLLTYFVSFLKLKKRNKIDILKDK